MNMSLGLCERSACPALLGRSTGQAGDGASEGDVGPLGHVTAGGMDPCSGLTLVKSSPEVMESRHSVHEEKLKSSPVWVSLFACRLDGTWTESLVCSACPTLPSSRNSRSTCVVGSSCLFHPLPLLTLLCFLIGPQIFYSSVSSNVNWAVGLSQAGGGCVSLAVGGVS